MSTAVLGSVAAAVLCLGGFGAVVADAGPGDPLYGLRTMLFGEQQAPRDDAVQLASQQLAEVQQLIDQGQWEAAQDKLQTLTTTVATVNDVEQKQELVTQWQELTVKVETQDVNATVPPNVPAAGVPGTAGGRARHDHVDDDAVGDHHAVDPVAESDAVDAVAESDADDAVAEPDADDVRCRARRRRRSARCRPADDVQPVADPDDVQPVADADDV